MVYVSRAFNVRDAYAWSKEHIAEHEQEIKRVNQRFMPIEIEHKNGDKYLFMSIDYYEKHFKIGRHKGIDYMTIQEVPDEKWIYGEKNRIQ